MILIVYEEIFSVYLNVYQNWFIWSLKFKSVALESLGMVLKKSTNPGIWFIRLWTYTNEMETILCKTLCTYQGQQQLATWKVYWFLFPFSSKFPDLQFAPYVLYNLFTHVVKPHTWHKQWAWITCGERNGKQTWRRLMSFIVSIGPNCLKEVQFFQQIMKIMHC